ncbi:MAG: nicotinamide riboside transporter PnuC [Bacteroidales bacterium]|jgi:nicotinamide mononucleotide transporter|nr:nicotinamide riboside transporter PnuC [Bacteroidales bacterium]
MDFSWIEILGFAGGIIYTLFEILQLRAMWIIALVTATSYAIIFYSQGIYAQMGLQIYFVIMSFYGIWQWTLQRRNYEKSLEHSNLGTAEPEAKKENSIIYCIPTGKQIAWGAAILCVLTAVLYLFIGTFSKLFSQVPDPYPFWDALATALSILGTYWLSKSYLYQWWLWIAADIMMAVIFAMQYIGGQNGMVLSVILYAFYIVSAFYGIWHWKKSGVRI